MNLFLSFLLVKVEIVHDCPGCYNGWTLHINKDEKLKIRGGIVNGIEYLDAIEYGEKLQNKYNNCCNPFYLFDILNLDGKKFFINYYMVDIQKLVKDAERNTLLR